MGTGERESIAYIEVELICPVADDFILCRAVSDLVLVDLITAGGISVLVEQHGVASNA